MVHALLLEKDMECSTPTLLAVLRVSGRGIEQLVRYQSLMGRVCQLPPCEVRGVGSVAWNITVGPLAFSQAHVPFGIVEHALSAGRYRGVVIQ